MTSINSISARGAKNVDEQTMYSLQKKLAGLMKKLEDASKDRSKGALERLKLLQIQIEGIERQIQQLQLATLQKSMEEKLGTTTEEQSSKKESPNNIEENKYFTDVKGTRINTIV